MFRSSKLVAATWIAALALGALSGGAAAAQAAARLHDATTNRDGMRMAFVADDVVVMAFTWSGPYGMDADLGSQLSIPHGMSRARPLVAALRRCIEARGGARTP